MLVFNGIRIGEGRAYSAEKTVQHNSTKMLMNRILCIFAGRRDSLDDINSLNSRDSMIVLVSSTICGFVSVYAGIQPTALSAGYRIGKPCNQGFTEQHG